MLSAINIEPTSIRAHDHPDHPKVALLFLTTGAIHNEPIWRAFFEASGTTNPVVIHHVLSCFSKTLIQEALQHRKFIHRRQS